MHPISPVGFSPYRRLTVVDKDALAEFLTEHYGDETWYLDTGGDWLRTYLEDKNVIILGLLDTTETIRGCIFSTPFSRHEEPVAMGGHNFSNVRVIEGLCIHKDFRKKGLANYLLSAIDRVTSQHAPTIHFYSRELPYVPLLSSHLNVKTYAYIECSLALRKHPVEQVDWDTFCMLWDSNKSNWSHLDCIASPVSRRGDVTVWRCKSEVIVVTNTRRRTRAEGRILWETIWCGTLVGGLLYPNRVSRESVESVASMYTGVLFIMREQCMEPTLGASWRVGWSGVHAWYIYNFLPPTFGGCELQVVREEI